MKKLALLLFVGLVGRGQQIDWIAQTKNKPIIDVRNYGLDNTGVAAAVAALGTSGKILNFPVATYTATTNVDMTGKYDFIVAGNPIQFATGYSGIGKLIGHSGGIGSHLFVDTRTRAGAGQRMFSIIGQVHADNATEDSVGVYGAAEALPGNGSASNVFGGNFLALIAPSSTPVSVVGTEFDVNNNLRPLTGLSDTLNPIGVQTFSGGDYNGKYAHVIGATSTANRWLGGIWFTPTSVSDYAIDMTSLPADVYYPVRYRNTHGPATANAANTKVYNFMHMNASDQFIINPEFATTGKEADVVVGIASGAGKSFSLVNASGQTTFRQDGSGRTEVNTYLTYATLGTPTANAFVFCSDCTVGATCSGSGTGAWAFYSGSTWKCPF